MSKIRRQKDAGHGKGKQPGSVEKSLWEEKSDTVNCNYMYSSLSGGGTCACVELLRPGHTKRVRVHGAATRLNCNDSF